MLVKCIEKPSRKICLTEQYEKETNLQKRCQIAWGKMKEICKRWRVGGGGQLLISFRAQQTRANFSMGRLLYCTWKTIFSVYQKQCCTEWAVFSKHPNAFFFQENVLTAQNLCQNFEQNGYTTFTFFRQNKERNRKYT